VTVADLPQFVPTTLKGHFHSRKFSENFVKCDWPTQILRWEKNSEVENFQLLTMIFSGNFLSVEIFLQWKFALIQAVPNKLL
jgi:hypothetical protein